MAITSSTFQKVAAQLYDFSRIHAPKVNVTVGFTAAHATLVHEDLSRTYRNGEAKFLQKAINLNIADVDTIVEAELKAGKTMKQAMYKSGEFVLSDAQAIVPVDTGELRDSGFIRVRDA